MKVEAIAVTSFIHDRINASYGDQLSLEESLASQLERNGLVRVLPRRVDMALMRPAGAAIVGKVPAAGQALPSSSSPAARPSQQPTLHLPKRGPGRPRKNIG